MIQTLCLIIILSPFFSIGQPIMQKDLVQIQAVETILKKGTKDTINVEITVKDGYHIQANKVNDESLIPATLSVTPTLEFAVDVPVFPPHKLFRLEGTEDILNVFDGKFLIKLPVTVLRKTASGKYIIKAVFHYQACNHKTCFFPRIIHFEMNVVIN